MAAYRGRFAPSPTGPLHFGSLIAAIGSYLEARIRGGQWLVRIEDLDPPREMPGAGTRILRSLEAFGLHWDGEVLHQSARIEAYREVLDTLLSQDLAYPCGCSRKDIGATTPDAIYPGTCREGLRRGKAARAIRLRVSAETVAFGDRLQGEVQQHLDREVGDFVIRRADGLFAYQLAVVVDDAAQGITDVVRGCDLLDSTPRQIYLQRLLGLPTPAYVHLPVAVNAQGEKLSKQTFAAPLDDRNPAPTLWQALRFLNQGPPAELRNELTELWRWALQNWRLEKVPSRRAIAHPDAAVGR